FKVRVVRCRSSAPTWFSRNAIARLTAAGERPSRRPAPARLPSSSAAMKTFIASMRSILRSVPHVADGGFLAGDEILQRLVDRGIDRRRLVAPEHAAELLMGALGRGLLAGIAPLLEGIVVGDGGIPERGLVVLERMGAAEEMLARPDLAEGVERHRVL